MHPAPETVTVFMILHVRCVYCCLSASSCAFGWCWISN